MKLKSHARAILPLAVLFLAAGCGDEETPVMQPPPALPEITDVAVTLNPSNNLSTIVTFSAKNAESARVVYTAPGGTAEATPFYPVQDGENRIVTLGLDSLTTYSHHVEAIGPEGETSSDPVELASGDFPDFFKNDVRFTTSTPVPPPDPQPVAARRAATRGYILLNFRTAPNIYAAAFDGAGQLRWYQAFDELGGFITQHANGNLSVFLGSTTGYHPLYGYYVEFTPAGDIVARHQAPPPFYTDNHELLLQDGSVHFISYSIRRLDLSAYGGLPDVPVAGHQILRCSPDGGVEFMWNGWDHLDLSDWIAGRLIPDCSDTAINCDIDHANALWIDGDGDYIYSIRNFSQIWKIDSRSGRPLWKLGAGGDFTFVNDPLNGFSAQHYSRTLDNGNLLLYDNGTSHTPPQSRAVEYALDPVAKTATMVWEFRHDPPIYTGALGYAERLANGNTVVGFGQSSTVTEVDPAGNVVWEGVLRVNNRVIGVYRFFKIASLYEYERP